MLRQFVFILLLAFVLPACASRPIGFDSSFESGNGTAFELVAPDTFTFEIEPDTNSTDRQWYAFDVTGAKGRTLTFRLLNTDTTNVTGHWRTARPIFSRDGGETWSHVDGPTVFEDNTYTFTHELSRNRERIAFHYPYTHTMALAKMAEWQRHRDATRVVLGQSIEGRDIDFFRVTDESTGPDDRKLGFWTIARQHSAEVTASFTMEGFIDFLLSEAPEAITLRQRAVFNIVPMVNPDGVVAGNYRDNIAGENLNRVWDGRASLDTSPEVLHVQTAIDAWVAAGKPYDMFIDFHSTSGSGPHFAFHAAESVRPELYKDPARYHADTRAFLELINGHCAHFSPTRGASSSSSQQLAYTRQREQYGVLSFTFEGTYNRVDLGPNAEDYQTPQTHREVGIATAKAMLDYYDMRQ